ncbi:B12-binding domain-containing protein [Alkalihalobacillus trypoxylicola]|nr:cobalamin B12-binding domain-containing protein [Alkalihalobacillus trypoxylicola]
MNEHSKDLADHLLKGNEKEAMKLINTYQCKYPGISIFEDLITPAMYYIGELWEHNKISVADEHLATAVCDMIISQLSILSEGTESNQKIMLLGLEEEQHYLGLRMVGIVFKKHGWDVKYLGPNLPLGHMLNFIDVWKPDVVGVSVALPYRLPTLIKYVESLEELHSPPQILVGGRMAEKIARIDHIQSDYLHIMNNLTMVENWIQERNTETREEKEFNGISTK